MSSYSTPWAIICPTHGITCLTEKQYSDMLNEAHLPWKCPICGAESEWDESCPEAQGLDDDLGEDEVA